MTSTASNRLPKLHTATDTPVNEVAMPSPEHESLTASLASKTEPRTAASNFTEPARKAFAVGASESAIESCLSRSWNGVTDVATDTQHESQGPLIDIVQAVQQQNLAEQEDASECTIWGRN
jgi:hypothetical protein